MPIITPGRLMAGGKQGSGGVGGGVPPSNSVAPAITGTAQVGQSLSCSTGTWSGDATITYAYQWQTSANGSTGWTTIVGATSSSYTVVSGDLNQYLRCAVTGTNGAGNSTANSAATAQVTGAASLDGSESDGTQLFTGGNANVSLSAGGLWGAQNSSFSSAQTSPSGASNANILIEAATTAAHRCYAHQTGLSIAGNAAVTISIYAKMSNRRYLTIRINAEDDTNGFSACFDLQAAADSGTHGSFGNGSYSSCQIQAGANSFYKCSVSGVLSTSLTTGVWCYLSMNTAVQADVGTSYLGDGSSGIFLWRPKLTQP